MADRKKDFCKMKLTIRTLKRLIKEAVDEAMPSKVSPQKVDNQDFIATWEMISSTIEDPSFCDEDVDDSSRNQWITDILIDNNDENFDTRNIQDFLSSASAAANEYYYGYVSENSPGRKSEHRKQYQRLIADLKMQLMRLYK